jgi:hypothetical protein
MSHLTTIAEADSQAYSVIRTSLQEVLDTLRDHRSGASQSQRQDRREIDDRIRGFDMKSSQAYSKFWERGWTDLTFHQRKSMGEVIASKSGLSLDRQTKRRKVVFLKWCNDNWEVLEPHVMNINPGFSSDGE